MGWAGLGSGASVNWWLHPAVNLLGACPTESLRQRDPVAAFNAVVVVVVC